MNLATIDRPVIYEVNLTVEAGVADQFVDWLTAHVDEMLAIAGFEAAEILEQVDHDGVDEVAWCVKYTLRDGQSLENYFSQHAERMRNDGKARFGDQFRATRRILVAHRDS